MKKIRSLARRFRVLIIIVMSSCVFACNSGGGSSSKDSEPPVNDLPPVDIFAAAEINAVISNVTIASPPVVQFQLTNETGNPVTGLPASYLAWVFAKLVPGVDGNPGYWQSYINEIEQPGVGPGTEPKLQATTESGTEGELVELSNGSYEYTFATDVTNVTIPEPVEYVPTITHRVSLEVRVPFGAPAVAPVRNPSFDFRPSGGSLLFEREIATIETCNTCHGDLRFHGAPPAPRNEIQNCVTCHNPFSADANSGNSVDMTEMTHKIHLGSQLPSVQAGEDYCIYGFRDEIHCYGDVVYTAEIQDCSGCHDENDPQTPQAARWYQVPSDTACGSCHDDVNFVTGENHGENGSAGPADNTGCATCHAANPDSPIEVRNAHNKERRAAANYQFNILEVTPAAPTVAPMVTFSVTNPLDNDAAYDLGNNPDLFSRMRFYVAWNTIDYTNNGLGTTNSQPQSTNVYDDGVLQANDNLDGTYDIELTPVAAVATGSGVVTLEGNVNDPEIGRLRVPSTFGYFAITDPEPVARREKVDIARCNDCHNPLTFHGGSRNDSIEVCQVCHNPDAARGSNNGPMDMKYFVHRIHAVDDILYPQPVSNCLACHTDDGFYPFPLSTGILATSETRGTDETDPTDNNRFSPNSAACVVCHEGGRGHMEGRGGSFDACQETDGTLRVRVDFCGPGGDKSGALVTEGGCASCHGPGGRSDVAVNHGLNL